MFYSTVKLFLENKKILKIIIQNRKTFGRLVFRISLIYISTYAFFYCIFTCYFGRKRFNELEELS